MPMFLSGRKPNHVTRVDFLNRTALALNLAAAERGNQNLPEGMRMPGGPGARLEGDAVAGTPCRFRGLK